MAAAFQGLAVLIKTDDDDMRFQLQSAINDALTNTWREGLTLNEWTLAAARLVGLQR